MGTGNHAGRWERAERLKQARIKAGFKTVRAGAEAAQLSFETYRSHEMARNGYGIEEAQRYARVFKVDWKWLTAGEGEGPTQGTLSYPLPIVVPAEVPAEDKGSDDFPTIVEEAKQRLARTLGVDPSKITLELKMTISGV